MKFNTPCFLYYVCPFVFSIEQVFIDFSYREENGDIYYISKEGAYLTEQNLFLDLKEARGDALQKLNKFYGDKMNEIMYSQPKPEKEL